MVVMCLPCTHYNNIVIPWRLLVDGADLVHIILCFCYSKVLQVIDFFQLQKSQKMLLKNFSTQK